MFGMRDREVLSPGVPESSPPPRNPHYLVAVSSAVAAQPLPPAARPASLSGSVVALVWLMACGLSLAAAFHAGTVLPRNVSIIALWVLTFTAIWTIRASHLSLLPRLLLIAYSAPFFATLGYLVWSDFLWWFTPRAVELQSDPLIIREMMEIGLLGFIGLYAGMLLAQARPARVRRALLVHPATLELVVFVVLIAVATLLSWLSAPGDSILDVAVGQGTESSRSRAIGFPGAWLASYLLLLALVIDVERERVRATRRVKWATLSIAITYIVVVLNLLEGDRECTGLLAALAAFYLTPTRVMHSAAAVQRLVRKRLRVAIPAVAFGFLVLVGLGSARYSLADKAKRIDPVTIVRLGLGQNTWTGVLLTNLGSTYEYRTGISHFVFGRTYLDYLLSLPPGPLTAALGIERPLEPTRGGGSATLGDVTGGGLHVVIIPFENFGAWGVVLLLAIFGFGIVRSEQYAQSGRLLARMVWGGMFCTALFWFWYGDMNVIRGLMGAVVVAFLYRVALSVRLPGTRARSPAS